MKILFTSVELYPFAKVGGIADLAYGLSSELAKIGHEVNVVIPKYGFIDQTILELYMNDFYFEVLTETGSNAIAAKIFKKEVNNNLKIYFIDFEDFSNVSDRNSIYLINRKYGDWSFDKSSLKFIYFSKAVIDFCLQTNYQPDIFHCNDWTTALIPVYLKLKYNNCFKTSKSIINIHSIDIFSQGRFYKDIIKYIGLPENSIYRFDVLAFYPDRENRERVSLLKGGIQLADSIITVSKKYAEEIQTHEFGYGLSKALRYRKNDLYGVLSGIDCEKWNPERDNFIREKYSASNLKGKIECKKHILKRFYLRYSDDALIGIVCRLITQKGLKLIQQIIKDIINRRKIKFIVAGTGERNIEEFFKELQNEFPEQVGVKIGYAEEELVHQIISGSDIFLMPSKSEGCGLSQMYSLQYGTIPIVHDVGGLHDTIIHYDESNKDGNGFKFKEYSPHALAESINYALNLYSDKTIWEKIISNAMKCDFSWEKSVKEYERIYKETLSN